MESTANLRNAEPLASSRDDLLPCFAFYVLTSEDLVADIEARLGHPTEVYKCIAMRRRVDNGSSKETRKKTIFGCTKRVVEEFKAKYPREAEYLADYCWDTFTRPNSNSKIAGGEMYHLHISNFPDDFDADDRRAYVNNRLLPVLTPEHYDVHFSTKSRQTGSLQSFAKLTFKDYVPIKTREYAKVLLNHEEVKRIPSFYLFSPYSSEKIDDFDAISKHITSLLDTIPLQRDRYTVSQVEGSDRLFKISFHQYVPENVRRATKDLVCKQIIYQSCDKPVPRTDAYISAIWFDTNKAMGASHHSSSLTNNHSSSNQRPELLNGQRNIPIALVGYPALKFPSRVESGKKLLSGPSLNR